MIRTILIPLLAILGIVFAAYTVVRGSVPPTAPEPVIEPPRPPFSAFVAGAGLIEASSENIAIGTPVGALVRKVSVNVGDVIKKGDPLFTLDARELEAELLIRQAALRVAQQQLTRLEAGTRPEQIPPQRARVSEAQADILSAQSDVANNQALLDDAKAQLDRAEGMTDTRALSAEEVTRRRFTVNAVQARLDSAKARVETARARASEAQAQLALLEAGTWNVDIDVAKVQVEQAQAGINAIQIEIDRRVVRSPVDGKVIQKNVREGEFAQAGALSTPLMLVGQVIPLHVRVDVDEYEAWRVKPGSKARAFARGNKDIATDLQFVRFEPYIVPKRSLTGASTERVDTRVLQVIFAFDPKDLPLFVGQQVDVYIESDPVQRGNRPAPATDSGS
jgi:HlyD family secretion protein